MTMTDELFEEYKRLVYFAYKKLEKTKFVVDNKDDLLQEGFLAMVNAIETYTDYRGVKLSSYILHCATYRMWRYIERNSKSYSITETDITAPEYAHLAAVEDTYGNVEDSVEEMINDYKYYLKHYKSKSINIEKRLMRARIIIEEYVNNGHRVTTREIEERYCISRQTVTDLLRELRSMLTLKFQNKLYM